ncbi:hypothetical protein HBO04_20945 [Pseudomonas proteolytica]|uniref:hypothetical protein n=1 Tax=Pseudomonas proteolytica TaxID=219574 RepID=UPI0014754882|nr:hypothetical protein [Pseudomonas proteolytica]NMZ02593.1 hypothetical protein [Pseudomonas proteolytica]
MGIKISVNHRAIAEAIIKSGDLHREDCGCGLSYEHDDAQELQELIGIALDVIEVFGEAGLRALVNQAERRADELDLKVRAETQAKAAAEERSQVFEDMMVAARNEIERAERARVASGAGLSDYDQVCLMNAVSSVGGDFAEFDFARALVLRGVYTVPEIMKLSREHLRHLLS